jgi:hypothetical protein
MIRNSSGKTTTMETVSPSQTQICPVSTSDSFWCVVPFCWSLLSAVVRQHLSHSARGIYDLGIKQLSYANLVVDQSKSLSSPTKNAVFAAISTLSWRLCHWNRETLSNSTAILSWKQQQLSWEKKSAAKIWKQNPFIHSFIHSFIFAKTPICSSPSATLRGFLWWCGQNNNFAFICDDCGEEKNMESS